MAEIQVVRSGERAAWSALVDPPGEQGTGGAALDVFASTDRTFTTGLWEREPDTWSFERPYHEVAIILAGRADIEEPDGTVHSVGPGDVLVTAQGTKGTWRIHEKIVKFWAIYDSPAE
jgi:uncharacterized cupin superfamily protein